MGVIETQGLTKRYGSTLALDDLTLDVVEGEVFGFLGPNGAGKTTTIRVILGMLKPSSGTATVLGLDAWRDAKAVHRRAVYVPGEFIAWPQLTGEEMLELLARLHGGTDRAYRDELIERFDFEPAKRGRAYSRGNRQKIPLIAAFASRADLLILDEPTTGLDPLMEIAFRDAVREAAQRGQTAFLSSHILSEVEATCDRVALLRAGRLVDVGTLEHLGHLRATNLDVTFRGAPPKVDGLEGVTVIEQTDGVLRLAVTGEMEPVVKALARSDVVELFSRKPSLEDIFLTHYARA